MSDDLLINLWVAFVITWNWIWPVIKVIGYVLGGIGIVALSALMSWLGIKTPLPQRFTIF